MTENQITKIIEIDASPEVIFKALTEQDELTQWFPDKAIFEPRVGGKMHFTFNAAGHKKIKDNAMSLGGQILEIIPNKKLVYTFMPGSGYKPDGITPPTTTVTWNLEEAGKNKTRVTLVHTGFTKEMANQFKETTDGWNYFTARLIQYCRKK